MLLISACATYKPQYKDVNYPKTFPNDKEIEHSFYVIGDAGNAKINKTTLALEAFKDELNKASKNSTAIFLGDNIYEAGMPKKEHEHRKLAEHRLDVQIEAVKGFKGKTVFVPGNHDWYSGIKGLKRQERYIEDALGKNTFLPENGCPIEKVNISDDIVLIILDSQWYITNWDKHPTINDECDIKTRALFFDEVESQIKKARGKTTIIAVHNPLFTNGNHGGQYSFKSHMKPLPVLGTLKNVIRKTGGVANVDDQNKVYREFKKRLITLSQENDKVIFVSGHDHNLQYIVKKNIPQIVSGSGAKLTPTRNIDGGEFSYRTPGYARLDVFTDGSTYVRFYSAKENKIVYQTEVRPATLNSVNTSYSTKFDASKKASIYTKEETQKSGFFKALWGERYRKYYSTEVLAPTVNLDTLFGGLKPTRVGGGNQSRSLRLEDAKGREYVMRALRKNAVQYLQAVAFKDQYIKSHLSDTYTEGLLLDVFTGSHPYAPFTIATLANAVGVMHTNPKLYYVPKQRSLGDYNSLFGDELYMIEERAADDHGDKVSFGFSNELISTHDMLLELRKDEDNIVDEKAYIRARLFDMLIGDWDRHEDQWRWAKFKEGKKTVYRPMPRDRDQAFSIMADGTLLSFATTVLPALRLMKSYDEELKSPKWFNLEPYPLDVALINKSNRQEWSTQAKHIVDNLTNEVIDQAFKHFPQEVADKTIDEIRAKLIGRRANLQKISDQYFKHVNKYVIVRGTDKDDLFEVQRQGKQTRISGFRIKDGKKGDTFYERTFSDLETKEIWIYGLDDKDVFKVSGKGSNLIKVRLIGGQNNDTYNIENGHKIKVYDYLSKKNTFVTDKGRKKLTDDYETNVYNYKKPSYNSNQFIPSLGANPDDGFKLGFVNTYKTYGFERNPYTSNHIISGAYYFATNGFELSYIGDFANVIGSWNLNLETVFTSPNYSVNFFGFGNKTSNPEAEENDGLDVDLDYNRVKIRTFKVAPSLVYRGVQGASFKAGIFYESNEVQDTQGRYISTPNAVSSSVFDKQDFYGLNANYRFENRDNDAFPTLGMMFDLETGYKNNVSTTKGFGYVISSLAFDYKLIPSGQLVLATKVKGHVTLGDGFEFYQAASLGADNGLRGYRNQRFTGKNAFYQTTDLRLNLRKLKTGLLPLNIGFYGGIDYGRVWVEGDNSNKWNNSFGGGIFFNGANMITGNLSAFNSDDGLRLAFKLGFGF